jgi:molybdate transport system substrate-binding protein
VIRRVRVAMVTVLADLVIAGGAVFGACAAMPGSSHAPSTAVQLSIYAAASLKDALVAVSDAYETERPGTTLVSATDSSSTLRTQIEEGAPADVFLSADETNPDRLVEAGLVDGHALAFAGNRLTIIAPADNPAGIETPADLARPGVRIIAAGDAVPITRYAQQVVDNLAADPSLAPGFAEAYAANVASREENVKAVAAKIELGEGDAAMVYVTDALAASDVAIVEIPPFANVRATYAGVVVGASPRVEAAHAFLDWLAGPEGVAILARFGFEAPS